MKNIFLIGFMGAGKTTVAQAFHKNYGMELLEMDEQIEAEQKKKISEIFAKRGEEYFRNLETELLLSMKERTGVVVSCGGGVPMRACNVAAMRESGVVVYLSASPQTVYDRVKDAHTRPLLENNMSVEYISQLQQKRLPAYQAAADITVTVDGKDADAVCAEIIEQIMG